MTGTWQLGDFTVNRLGYGAMRITGPGDRERALALLRQAVDLGVNHIDTAAFYFSPTRSANELINSALSPYPDDLLIATKVGPGRNPDGEWLPLARPDQLRGQVEENLRQLGRDRLDLVNLRVHGLDSVAEHFGVLADLRAEGLIRHLGLSNVRSQHLAQAQEIAPVVCVQNIYAVDVGRTHDDLVRECGEQGIAFVPFFSVAGPGRDDGRVAAEPGPVEIVAKAHHVSTARVRIAWTLHLGSHVLAIPGTGNPDHLVDNLQAGSLRLDDAEMALLSRGT